METGIAKKTTHETEVVAGLRIIESEVRIDRPVFVDMEVKIPKFIEEKLSIPVGFDTLANDIADLLYHKIQSLVTSKLEASLKSAIDERIKEISVPKIIYKDEVTVKNVEVLNAVVKDVHVNNAVITDVQVKNAVVENINLKNAVVQDVSVINAVISNVPVTNAIIKDVEVQNAILKHKTVDVIHPRYVNLSGKEITVGA